MATRQDLPEVLIYTDGGADPNPGPGGWGAVLISGLHTKEISGAEWDTTNNRMEITAAISALRILQRPCRVTIYTDSQYLRRGISEWMPDWVARGWRKANGQPVENVDLWQELLREMERHQVEWQWVKGHRGHPLNERADQLATEARQRLVAGGRREPTPTQPPPTEQGQPEQGKLPHVEIYTRGAALGTPGPGGYAAVIVNEAGKVQVVSGGWPLATSNVMELWAVVAGLRSLRQLSQVTLYTTSKYVLDGATRWLAQWEQHNWQTKAGEPVKNQEIWMELARTMGDHDVTWAFMPASERNPYSQQAAEAARREAEQVKAQASRKT
ncbi:MAG: ribonuclease HI [Chloroflexi bacterium]|jgi:ribonuclease HI|nr:ribonuclease HI [Chloroflexota bacterium]